MWTKKRSWLCTVVMFLLVASFSFAKTKEKALLLPKMTWVEVREYLQAIDMVIIPLGSTEQHGPHLPLGTDYYEAVEISKMISAQTSVVVAPVLWVGYSVYHSGFPGTLSLKPETMEQVLFESVEMLVKYGFRRFLFFNYHGGNDVVQQNLIHRINHTTEAVAVAIGHGSLLQKTNEKDEDFDWHAGKSETSIMLYLMPHMVRMNKAQKPTMHFTPQMEKLRKLAEKSPELMHVVKSLLGVPAETQKGGASHEISNNGVWSFDSPRSATKKRGKEEVNMQVEKAVKFIRAWKQVS